MAEEAKVEATATPSVLSGDIIAPGPLTTRGKPAAMGVSSDGSLIIYPHPAGVVIRSVTDPTLVYVYRGHRAKATAAAFSVDGTHVASGDEKGNVHVWKFDAEQTLVNAVEPAVGGSVVDVAWSSDGETVAAVGSNKPYISAFVWNKGSSAGTFVPMTKTMLSVAMSPSGPARLAVSSEEMSISLYGDKPFEVPIKIMNDHTNFPNCVRFSPDGKVLASVSSDKQIIFWNAETGDKIHAIEKAHKGSIYTCSWSPDGQTLVTASADKTVCSWDTSSYERTAKWTLGTKIPFMQNAAVATAGPAVSVSLNGTMNFLEASNQDAPASTISSGSGNLQSLAFDAKTQLLVAAYDHNVVTYSRASGTMESALMAGGPETEMISSLAVFDGTAAVTAGRSLYFVDLAKGTFGAEIGCDKSNYAVTLGNNGKQLCYVAQLNKVLVFVDGAKTSEAETRYDITSVALSADCKQLLVGSKDKKVHFFSVADDGAITETGTGPDHLESVLTVAVAADGKHGVAADSKGDIRVYNMENKKCIIKKVWTKHAGRVDRVAFSPNGEFVASVAGDGHLRVWEISSWKCVKTVKGLGRSNGVAWVDDTAVWTGGFNGVLKLIEV